MSSCRTCLSKKDLKAIFPDKNLLNSRATDLFTVTGIKIQPNDGLPQGICMPCINLVNSALLLRVQSSKSNTILRNNLKQKNKSLKISKNKCDSNDNENRSDIKFENDINQRDSVKIEDFESSDDSQIMDSNILDDLNCESGDEIKVCIEDYESSDDGDISVLKEESGAIYNGNLEIKEKEFLEREKRKMESKELDNRLMSIAAKPYERGGPIRCTICSKKVSNKRNFKCHAKTHFEPQNKCEVCSKKFISRSHMMYHQQRVHGRTKRLACAQCPYRAVDPQQLQNHKRAAHTGERPYICDVCGDTFRMRANICQHMRKHFGVKNLQCERCPSMFRSRSELTNHQNRVHKHLYTYYCYLCTETYKRPASVRQHLVNFHGVPKNQQLTIKCVKTSRL